MPDRRSSPPTTHASPTTWAFATAASSDDVYFIAESELVVDRLVTSKFKVRSFLLSPKALRADASTSVERHARCPVYVADRDVMEQIAGFDLHRGVLASAKRRR